MCRNIRYLFIYLLYVKRYYQKIIFQTSPTECECLIIIIEVTAGNKFSFSQIEEHYVSSRTTLGKKNRTLPVILLIHEIPVDAAKG